MTTLVNLRHWRIEAGCLPLIEPAGYASPSAGRGGSCENDGAEIILFPNSAPKAKPPRKPLKRRFLVPERLS